MKVLIPLDQSELSLSILPAVRRLLDPCVKADARLAGLLATIPTAEVPPQPPLSAEVHLVTILRPRQAPREAAEGAAAQPNVEVAHAHVVEVDPPLLSPEARERLEQNAGRRLAAIAGEHFPEVLTRCHVIWSDTPTARIIEVAEEVDADAIAMATHGRSGVSRLLAGSVADGVIRNSRRPVIILRPPMNHHEDAHKNPGAVPRGSAILSNPR